MIVYVKHFHTHYYIDNRRYKTTAWGESGFPARLLEVLCEIKSGTNNNWDQEVIIIVDNKKVEYLTTEKAGENKEICKIAIGDQIKEILITHDEE